MNTVVFMANYCTNMQVFDDLFGGLKEKVYFCRYFLRNGHSQEGYRWQRRG